jgi:hypothetical protein
MLTGRYQGTLRALAEETDLRRGMAEATKSNAWKAAALMADDRLRQSVSHVDR